MFGFVKPFIPELRVKEYEFYKSIYCGLCRSMKKHLGTVSTAALSYDVVFLALIRLAFEYPDVHIRKRNCGLHPFKKRPMADDNPAVEYAAKAGAMLTYYKCLDGRTDEKGFKKAAYSIALPYMRKINKRACLAKAEENVVSCLTRLSYLEKEKCPRPDEVSDVFGELLGGLCAFRLSENDEKLAYQLGFHLGRWIYLADAAVDFEEDFKSGSYNPFIYAFSSKDEAKEYINKTLPDAMTAELSAMSRAFALIPQRGNRMIYECIENIIFKGAERAFAEAMQRKETKRNDRPLSGARS